MEQQAVWFDINNQSRVLTTIAGQDSLGDKKTRDSEGTMYNLYCFRAGVKDLSRHNFAREIKRYANESKKIKFKRKGDGRYYSGLKKKPEVTPFSDL